MNHLTDSEIQQFIDAQLTPAALTTAREHVAQCNYCAEKTHAYTLLGKFMRKIPLERVSPNFTQRVMSQLSHGESSSFAWKVLANLAPVLSIIFIVTILFVAFQISGVNSSPEITGAINSAESAYGKVATGIRETSHTINTWVTTLFPFPFASDGIYLTVYLTLFLGAVWLLDKYLFAGMIKKRQRNMRTI